MTGEREIRRNCREPRADRWVRRGHRGTPCRNATEREGDHPPMLIAAKVLGATVLAGALAASGVLTNENLTTHHDQAQPPATTLVSDPHATFQALAVGDEAQVSAGDAGTVTVKRTADGLEVAAVAPAADWTAATKT